MTVFNEWRPTTQGEERLDLDGGLALVLYRQSEHGEYFYRLAGWNHGDLSTGTRDLAEARKRALRGADLVLRRAVDQVASVLITLGTGFN